MGKWIDIKFIHPGKHSGSILVKGSFGEAVMAPFGGGYVCLDIMDLSVEDVTHWKKYKIKR